MEHWSLRGRLNIRSNNESDTINLNWQQDAGAFDITLSGTLGLGAVRITGDATGVVVEKAGEAPLQADSLETISTDILGYAFPAAELLYWIRGLPAPGSRADITYNREGLVATLSQPDAQGRRWEMQYDNYQETAGHFLPGRLRLEQTPYRLTFLISAWDIPSGDGS
jgi:outer membrane lipoprotein LolB